MSAAPREHIGDVLTRSWWTPHATPLAQCLRPLSWLYRALLWLLRLPYARGWRRAVAAPVPLVVVGNLVVGGAGKTPTVIALVRALQEAGRCPGVISRGYARAGRSPWLEVLLDTTSHDAGDEPVLIRRATRAPVWVDRQRARAAAMLCAAHPEVDVIVSDDGLQHVRLARDVEVIVFDERGAGNGLLLPAGPLREAVPKHLPRDTHVLYNAGTPTTPLPGEIIDRRLSRAWLLADWMAGEHEVAAPLSIFAGQRLLAAAGIAAPERFFGMLEQAGLSIERLPLPDHFDFATLPWPPTVSDVLVTEKDAVKLGAHAGGQTRIWVVGLDFVLPTAFLQAVLERLSNHAR